MDAAEIESRLKRVKLVILDVDGVLTDGRIIYGDYGDELKAFDIADGMGINLLKDAGIPCVVISGRTSKVNDRRAKELKVAKVFQRCPDKLKILTKVIRKYKISAEDVCCVGDDLNDVPILRRAGLAVAVQNAVAEVKSISHYVTARSGGRGAVREIADKILKTQGKWQAVTEKFFL